MVRTMPRILSQGLKLLPPSFSFVIMAIGLVSLLSTVALLCGSEKANKIKRRRQEKTVRLGYKTPVKRLQSSVSSKALLLAKMISWRKVQSDGEEEEENNMGNCWDDDDEEAIWRKTIIKGEKCRPLNFSGKILYDTDGNLIPDDTPHPPQSKWSIIRLLTPPN